MIHAQPVTVADVLRARDERAEAQESLRQKYGCTLVSFTMNIAGPVKVNELIIRGFQEGEQEIDRQLRAMEGRLRERRETLHFTGCEAMWAIDAKPWVVKRAMQHIEDTHPLGRLFDIDVIDGNGTHLSRREERPCLICGGPAKACARSRAHSAEEVFGKTMAMLCAYFNERYAVKLSHLALTALTRELRLTPKPGLVDMENNGAHTDMDVAAFERSIRALRLPFMAFARIGMEGADPARLQQAGIEAEQAMLAAAGVNTHKGAIFSLGILCCAAGALWQGFTLDQLLAKAAELGGYFLKQMKKAPPADTGGGQQYMRYGLTGARGEAAAGFPSVREIALPAYEAALREGRSREDAGLHALLHLIAHVQDSNIIRRAGMEGQQWASAQARSLLDKGYTKDDLRVMNDRFVQRNISPGGSADLLAATYFIHTLTTKEASL